MTGAAAWRSGHVPAIERPSCSCRVYLSCCIGDIAFTRVPARLRRSRRAGARAGRMREWRRAPVGNTTITPELRCVHRGSVECVPCHGQCGRPALHPASRRAARLPARARRPDRCLRRASRSTDSSSPRATSPRIPRRIPLPDRLRQSAAHQAVGRGPRRRGRRRAAARS